MEEDSQYLREPHIDWFNNAINGQFRVYYKKYNMYSILDKH